MRAQPGITSTAWALIGGILLGAWSGDAVGVGVYLAIGAGATGWYAAGAWARSGSGWEKGRRAAALGAIVALGAGWYCVRQHHLDRRDVSAFVGPVSRLAVVRGVVETPATFSMPWRGAMGRFHYQREPNTLAVLRVETITGERATGRLLLRVREADAALERGVRLEARGWLSGFHGPGNPGEVDYRQKMRERGIGGQLTLASGENWTLLGKTARRGFSFHLGDAASGALSLGMADDPVRLAFLQTLLLGRWSGDLAGLDEQFRDVGLAHVLSISGAHLAILLGLIWLLCKLLLVRPPHAAMVVAAVLVLFLVAIPPFVPVVRAGIMAAVMCAAVWQGRTSDARRSLAAATVIVLMWRPGDLFSPGFQLSFLIVAALLSFTEPWTERLWPAAWIVPGHRTAAARIGRWLVGYLIVSVIAFTVALPIVIHHYRLISPFAVVLSVLSLPVITAVLALGYVKILLGLIVPGVSQVLAGPLRWSSDSMLGLVREAHGWPGAAVSVSGEPNAAWSVGWFVLIWAFWAEWFEGRRWAGIGAGALMIGWTVWLQVPWNEPAAQVHALSVGNGSCLVVRDGKRTVMFDCGSQHYFDVATRSVVPALKRMGVRRIDVLAVSHSDIDHYCGVLDVADAVTVGRVWIVPQMMAEAREHPKGPAAFLLNGLRDRGVTVQAVARGHVEAGLRVLGPAGEDAPKIANDASMVMAVELGQRKLLLVGDIQEEAIARLLAREADLRADVMELPHHGSIVAATGAMLDRVRPAVVLQSCGVDRTRDADWRALLQPRGIERCVTARQGMVGVRVDADGSIRIERFTQPDHDPAEE